MPTRRQDASTTHDAALAGCIPSLEHHNGSLTRPQVGFVGLL